jgi:hypothetical protein
MPRTRPASQPTLGATSRQHLSAPLAAPSGHAVSEPEICAVECARERAPSAARTKSGLAVNFNSAMIYVGRVAPLECTPVPCRNQEIAPPASCA